MAVQIQLRRGTAAEWTAANPVIASGELVVESDTNKLKLGNGVTTWTSLAYFKPGQTIDDLTDVTVTSATTGDVIKYNGTAWVNGVATTNLDSLTDVVITSAATGQTLTYDGTNWVNGAAASGGEVISSFLLMGA
jgi:hypothetical protein